VNNAIDDVAERIAVVDGRAFIGARKLHQPPIEGTHRPFDGWIGIDSPTCSHGAAGAS
jgi:hypothetical protein